MITHIVFVKFAPGSTPEEKISWRNEITALASKVPQVKGITAGNKVHVSEALKKADGGWDDGVVMIFDSMDDLKVYATSPAHEEYIKKTAKQTGEKMIYDIES